MLESLPLIGLENEYRRLTESLNKKQPLLLLGQAGSGKSALIRAAIADMPGSHGIIQLRYSPNLHHLLIDLTRCLLKTGHRSLRKLARPGDDSDRWASQQTSVHLKGILWNALEAEPCTIVLDGIEGGSFPMYRFLQRLYFAKGMAFVAAARDPMSLGALGRLFWDPRRIVQVRALNDSDAVRLFGLAADRFCLGQLKIDEFREKVVAAAKGNPGQIIEMCRLASNPVYVTAGHIKFAPLRIDALMKFV